MKLTHHIRVELRLQVPSGQQGNRDRWPKSACVLCFLLLGRLLHSRCRDRLEAAGYGTPHSSLLPPSSLPTTCAGQITRTGCRGFVPPCATGRTIRLCISVSCTEVSSQYGEDPYVTKDAVVACKLSLGDTLRFNVTLDSEGWHTVMAPLWKTS